MDLECWESEKKPEPAVILAEIKMEDLRSISMEYLRQLVCEAKRINLHIKFLVGFFADQKQVKAASGNEVESRDKLFLAVSHMFDCPVFDQFDKKFTQVPVAEQIDNIIIEAVKFRAYLHLQKFIGAKNPDPPPKIHIKILEIREKLENNLRNLISRRAS
jgi:hypothetical protein